MRFPFWSFVCSLAVFGQEASDSESLPELVYEKNGNVSVVGVFDVPDCGTSGRYLEEVASAIWTIEALNTYQYLPGITIGLSLFKTCGADFDSEEAASQLARSVSLRVENSKAAGILTTSAIYRELQRLKGFPRTRMVEVKHIIDVDTLVDLTVELLTNLQWMIVDAIVADSESVLNSFSERTSDEGICVRHELLITHRNISLELDTIERNNGSTVVIVIAEHSSIERVFKEAIDRDYVWIVVPSDFTFTASSGLPKNTMLLLPAMESENTLRDYITNPKRQRDIYNHREPTKSPLFLGVAESIFQLLKQLQYEHCPDGKQPCVNFMDEARGNKTVLLPPKSMKLSLDDIANDLKALKIEASPGDEMFLYIASLVQGNGSEDFAIFQISDPKAKTPAPVLLVINDSLLGDRKAVMENEQTFGASLEGGREWVERGTESKAFLIELPQSLANRSRGNLKKANESVLTDDGETEGIYPVCRNFDKNSTEGGNYPLVAWRFSTWVSVNTSLGFMVVMCTLSIMFFILCRVCKGDVLEGSPYFTLLLMLAVVLLFLTSLSFHFDLPQNNDLVCDLRTNAPPFAYAFLFSLLLSRSLMLSTSDGGNFVNHINGYLQTILFLFIFGIQLSLGLQFILHKPLYTFNEHSFILSLSYSILLLAFLTILSPFILRSKRNYREGLFFSISIFLILVVWSAWITFFVLFPIEHKDAAVAIGLNSTGTVLLLCLFIPRTYLMVAAVVRDRTAHSLPALDRNILTESCDANFKSSRSSDSVFGSITFRNSEMGLSNPNFTLGKSSGANRETTNECRRESASTQTLDSPQAK